MRAAPSSSKSDSRTRFQSKSRSLSESQSNSRDVPPGSGLRSLSVLAVACFLLYFIGLGSYPAVDPAEAYYVEAAREMLDLGNYITPHLNYQIYFSKPIMTFWLMAGSYNLFGVSEAAARLPFQLLASFMVFATYYAGRVLAGDRAGLFAGLSLAVAPLLLLVARESPIDIAFSAFLGLAVLATTVTLAERSRLVWPLIYIGLGLAMLTKGPAAILLYLMGAGAFLVLTRPSLKLLGDWLGQLKLLPGMGLFFLTIAPWHLAVWQQTEGLFLKVFFLYENIARYAGHTNMGRMSIWFFIPVLLVGFFPFILLLYNSVKESLFGVGGKMKEVPQKRGLAFLLAFSAMTFCFFSLSGTKLITYILPVVAPLALVTGLYLDKVVDDSELTGSRKLFSASMLFYGILVAGGLAFSLFYFSSVALVYKCLALVAIMIFAGGSILQYRLFRSGQFQRSVQVAFLVMVLGLSIIATSAAQLFYGHQQGDLMKISRKAGQVSDQVHMFGVFMPSSMFYARKPVNTFFLAKQLKPTVSEDKVDAVDQVDSVDQVRRSLIVRDRDLKKLDSVNGLKLVPIGQEGQWGLYLIPGYDVEKVMLLEDVFRNQELFERLMAGDTSTGPLTVPYAAGRARGRN